MENQNKENKKEIQVTITSDHKPVFSNNVQITVSNEEVILQFLFVRPHTTQGNLVSEVVLTPQHAIRLQKGLDETIKKHFTKHIE